MGPSGSFIPDSLHILGREGNSNGHLVRRNTSTSAARSVRSSKSKRFSIRTPSDDEADLTGEHVPKYKRDFLKFHSENGNRVVIGTFGPVKGVEMLLKKGYRHVYMSRHFARKHGLVPPEVVPGWVSFYLRRSHSQR